MSARSTSRTRSRAGGRRPVRKPLKRTRLADFLIKASIVVGMLLLVPALWAVAILFGLPVPMAEDGGATAVALFMLLCWPVALILIGGAVYYAKLFAKAEAAQAAREAQAETSTEAGDVSVEDESAAGSRG
jgi:multisubunit Na+/H+ antiporter MnhG subunit